MKQATQNIQATITTLERMTVAQLQAKYLEVFGEPSRSGNRKIQIESLQPPRDPPLVSRMQAWRGGDVDPFHAASDSKARAREL